MDSLAHLRTALYARFSSANQRDTSIDDQVRLCREYLNRNGGTLDDSKILTDYAVSGTIQARDGFDRLLKLVESKAVDLVVTESGDRLTRDLGDADRLWKLCEFHGVRLICVSDGIDSARDGSRMAFRFKAVMSDEFIHDLKKKTLRGMQGQHGRGFSTGGLPYGYKSEPVFGANRREPIGYEIQIDDPKAAVVRRIYEMSAGGHSLLTICTTLNDEGVPTPRGKDSKKFWRKTTVAEILRNRTYLGEFSFGKKQWRKDPTSRKRRYVRRSANDVQVDVRPHLQIVPTDIWDAVQARKKAVGERKAPARKTAHPFSGLLFCGVCGARMVDGGGSTVRYYRCNQAHSGGACNNTTPLREDSLKAVAVAELRRLFTETGLRERLQTLIDERLKTFKIEASDEQERLKKELARLDKEEARLMAFITSTDLTPALSSKIRDQLEHAVQQKREVETRLADLKSKASAAPPRVPSVDEIAAMVLDIETRMNEDPVGVREDLRRMLKDGRITMEPQADGSYVGRSHVLPLPTIAPQKRKTPAEARALRASVETVSCGGRIWTDSTWPALPYTFTVLRVDRRHAAARSA